MPALDCGAVHDNQAEAEDCGAIHDTVVVGNTVSIKTRTWAWLDLLH